MAFVFIHASLMNDFLIPNLVDSYNNNNSSPSVFVSHFYHNLESINWHTKLGHIAKIGWVD